MNANELRIGNYLLINNNVEIVSEISNACHILYEGGGFANLDKGYVFGIPLTEDWLIKFGFEYRNESRGLGAIFDLKKHPEDTAVAEWKFHKSVAFVCDKDNKEDVYLTVLTNPTAYKIKFVHQLQNLYFALTGEELNITT